MGKIHLYGGPSDARYEFNITAKDVQSALVVKDTGLAFSVNQNNEWITKWNYLPLKIKDETYNDIPVTTRSASGAYYGERAYPSGINSNNLVSMFAKGWGQTPFNFTLTGADNSNYFTVVTDGSVNTIDLTIRFWYV